MNRYRTRNIHVVNLCVALCLSVLVQFIPFFRLPLAGQASSRVYVESENSPRTISLVVKLSGEMCNIVSQLAYAKGVQLWMERHYHDLQIEIIGERPRVKKWRGTWQNLQCFPNLRQLNYDGGKLSAEYRERRQQQIAWVGADSHQESLVIRAADVDCGNEIFCLHQQLAFFHMIVLEQTKDEGHFKEPPNANVSLPFLTTKEHASFDNMVDQYYDELREWLRFDEEKCCARTPQPDETVFHLRNFRAEMNEVNYLGKGYEELDPNRTAMELFGHLKPGEKITVVSRFGGEHIRPTMEALKRRGLQASFIEGQTGAQDFCYLMKAQKELTGIMKSTYTRWAALLGDAKQIRLYSIDSDRTRKAHGVEENTGSHYNWKRQDLKSRIQYLLYKVD